MAYDTLKLAVMTADYEQYCAQKHLIAHKLLTG